MSVLTVLDEITSRGLSIVATGTDLKLQGPRERMDADLVGRIKACKPELIAHLAREAGFGLTPLQQGYLAGRDEVFELGNIASHVYHEIEGCWDLDRLAAALRAVVSRHGTLRTRFTEQHTQVQEQAVEVHLGRNDLRAASPAARARFRAELRERLSHRMLAVDAAPLVAAEVTLLSDTEMVLHVGHDGLVVDGISMFLFFRAWWAHYAGEDEPTGEEASFESYVAALDVARTRKPAQRSKAYWAERLDGLAGHPDLPLATSPSAVTHPRFGQRVVRVEPAAWSALKAAAAAEGLTPSGLLFAAYAEVLSRWGAGSRFTLNTTVANRPPIHPRILEAIGPFSHPLLVEVDLDHSLPFARRARAVQDRLRTDLDNRHFSGVEVLRELGRRRGGPARMPFTFNSAIGYGVPEVDGSALELFGPEVFTVSLTPQIWLNAFAMEQHGGAVIQLDGVDELFPAGLLDGLAEGYQRLLDALADPAAWRSTRFDLLPADQRARRDETNDTDTELPETLLQQPFVAQARRNPDAPAVITSTGALSYGELHQRAAVAAAWLRSTGVGRDELVGLVMTRGPEQYVGIMATVMAGAAYLPIDAKLPAERQDALLADGDVACVLTNAGWSDPTGRRPVLALDHTDEPTSCAVPTITPIAGAHPDDLAYVLYTSGTTGAPKGVMVSHRNVANVVADCTARFGVGPEDRLFAISAFNFDLSVYDVFGALSVGAAIVVPDDDRAADPAHWVEMCDRGGVTVWNSVPQIVALLHEQAVADGASALAALRLVMMSGDRIPPELPATLRGAFPELAVVSLGGPTETTIWNIFHPVGAGEDGSESIPYGRPNANNRAYVLAADGQDTPDWVVGEICASGAGLARGYWGDPERTDEKFFARDGVRVYRTGDLGRFLPSGEIDILGRADFQIKVNGYRIEAGEVETRLVAVPGVRQAVVARQAGARGDRLVAHLVPESDERPEDNALRSALRRQLPEYMVPSAVVWHDGLPLTANGKVDRSRLTAGPVAETAAAPIGDAELAPGVEVQVADLWESVLKVFPDALSRLADLGGNSLAAARILAGVRKRYGVTIPLADLPQVETVRAMADRIELLKAGAAWSTTCWPGRRSRATGSRWPGSAPPTTTT